MDLIASVNFAANSVGRADRRLAGMSASVTIPDDLARGLAAEAAKRGITRDEFAAEVLAERVKPRKHRLRFGAIGASTSGRSAA